MALDLLCASIVFKIPHMPNSRLQLRMGIHSGPAIGIVSGSKTPKYWYMNIYKSFNQILILNKSSIQFDILQIYDFIVLLDQLPILPAGLEK